MPMIVVSGPPRSGTSLMMQLLEAGGVVPLADAERPPDGGNPRGYYELAAAKRLPRDDAWLTRAEGRAVKVVHALLPALPRDRSYRVLWMERAGEEVLRSQEALLARREGRDPEAAAARAVSQDALDALARELDAVARAVDADPCFRRLAVSHAALLADAEAECRRVAEFLGLDLDVAAMAAAVDPALHRVRATSREGKGG